MQVNFMSVVLLRSIENILQKTPVLHVKRKYGNMLY
jgi:hypothetical protein